MLLRRIGTIAPLALLVAVLVHLALFGTEHAPGAEHAARLYSNLGAALALAALGSVLYAALRARRQARRQRRPGPHRARLPLELATGGTLAFWLIELAEGHTPLAGGAWQLTATAVAAYAVALFSRYVGRLLALSGRALAALTNAVARSRSFCVLMGARRACPARGAARARACRGRAPPLFA